MIEKAARLALSSRHPLAAAVAREAHDRVPYEGAIEVPGQGVRALIDGAEARLGSRAFCGVAKASGPSSDFEPGTSVIAFAHGDRSAVFAVRQTLGDGYDAWLQKAYGKVDIDINPRYGSWDGQTGQVKGPTGPTSSTTTSLAPTGS